MEKLHKYCLSVLLIIVCSNISAHTNNEFIKNVDCKKFYEIYDQFLSYEFETSNEFCLNENLPSNLAINQKENALHLLGNVILEKRENSFYNQKVQIAFSQQDKYDNILENFEEQNKQNDFAENIYFKNKVAKIRNKDDLDLKIKLRTLRWKS